MRVGSSFETTSLLKNLTVEFDDKTKSAKLNWDIKDFWSLGYIIFRKNNVNDNKFISSTDDFVYIGTTSNNHITDYTIGNNQTYCYQIELAATAGSSDVTSSMLSSCSYSDPITTNWNGWSISGLINIGKETDDGYTNYRVTDTWNFITGINEGSITTNTNRQSHAGAYKYAQFTNDNNFYESGTFTANLLEIDCPNGSIIYDDIKKVQAWNDFIYNHSAFLLKSAKGDVWIVSIVNNPSRQYENYINLPTLITYEWVQIANTNKVIIKE